MYQLDVDVSKLLFTHHQLFSKENVLASRLLQLFRNYLTRSEENLAEYYNHQLHAIKKSRLNTDGSSGESASMKEIRLECFCGSYCNVSFITPMWFYDFVRDHA